MGFRVARIPDSTTACNDGWDNDADGFIDWSGGALGEPADPGCADAGDLSERSPLLICDDGADNDGDELIDYPADPGCFSPGSSIENPQCQDGINNDLGQDPNPGRIDYDAGYSANGSPDPNGPDPQCVGKPWKNQEKKPRSTCGLGVELALLLPPLIWLWRQRSRL